MTLDLAWLVSVGALSLLALLAGLAWASWRAGRAAVRDGAFDDDRDPGAPASERRRRERRLGDRRGFARFAGRDDPLDGDGARGARTRLAAAPSAAVRDGRRHDDRPFVLGQRRGDGARGAPARGADGRGAHARPSDGHASPSPGPDLGGSAQRGAGLGRAAPIDLDRRGQPPRASDGRSAPGADAQPSGTEPRAPAARGGDAVPTSPGALALVPGAPTVTRLVASAAAPKEARGTGASGAMPPPPGVAAGAMALAAGPTSAPPQPALPLLPEPLPPLGGAPRAVARVLALERASDADWAAAVPLAATASVRAAIGRALPAVRPGHHALAFADDAALRIGRGDAGLMRSMATVHRFAASDRAWLDAPAATSVCGQVLATLAEARFLSRLAGEVALLHVEAERSSVASGLSSAVVRLLHDAREGYAVAIRSPAYQEAVDRAMRDARSALGVQRTLVGATANALRARIAAQRRDGARDNGDGALDLAHRLLAERRSEAMVLRAVCALDALRIALGIVLPGEDDLAVAIEQATVSDRALAARWPNLREALERVHLQNGERTARRAEGLRHGWRTAEQSAMLFAVDADGRVSEVRTSGFGEPSRA